MLQVAYTYDAGPNACLYLLENDIPAVIAAVNYMFPTDKSKEEYHRGLEVETKMLPDVIFANIFSFHVEI